MKQNCHYNHCHILIFYAFHSTFYLLLTVKVFLIFLISCLKYELSIFLVLRGGAILCDVIVSILVKIRPCLISLALLCCIVFICHKRHHLSFDEKSVIVPVLYLFCDVAIILVFLVDCLIFNVTDLLKSIDNMDL